MSAEEKRGSDRIVPMVSDEEMVVIEVGETRSLAKMMDLSDSGTLVYLLAETDSVPADTLCRLSLYHKGKVFTTSATVARTIDEAVSQNRARIREFRARLLRRRVPLAAN